MFCYVKINDVRYVLSYMYCYSKMILDIIHVLLLKLVLVIIHVLLLKMIMVIIHVLLLKLVLVVVHVLLLKILLCGARWPSDRVSDSGARGQRSIPTSAVLCP